MEVTNCAGLGSIVTGELPVMTKREAGNLLAEAGLLGTLTALSEVGRERDRWSATWQGDVDGKQRWLFTSQQQRMSLREMDIHEEHVYAAEAVDEDFNGSFS